MRKTGAPITGLLFIVLCLTGCDHKKGAGGNSFTNLSVVVWSQFPPPTNIYQHHKHLAKLQQQANAIIATNQPLFSQHQSRFNENSPLRLLLGVPTNEPANVSWSQTMDHRYITISSAETGQRFGRFKVNLKSGLVDDAYDVEALFVVSEMERRLRQIVGTREEALRLFRGGLPKNPSPEQKRATKALAEALFLPKDTNLEIRMSAPGGSNGGRGYLDVSVVSTNSWERVAHVGYPSNHGFLSAFGLTHPTYRFGGLRLEPFWTNLNTQGFLLDSSGIPYPP